MRINTVRPLLIPLCFNLVISELRMRILILNITFATKRFFSTETLIDLCDS